MGGAVVGTSLPEGCPTIVGVSVGEDVEAIVGDVIGGTVDGVGEVTEGADG